jgi:hypothetical protein
MKTKQENRMSCPDPYGLSHPRPPSNQIIALAAASQNCIEHLNELVVELRQHPDGPIVLEAIREAMLRLAHESRG